MTDKNGFILRHCPATNNLPTSMSRGAWDALCKATRTREMDQAKTLTGRDKLILPLCSTCNGEILPPKLTIIDLTETNDMATKGICDGCGDHSLQLRPREDKQLCGKCRTIFSNTANWLPVVEMALAEIYPEKYGPGAVIIGGSEGTLKAAVDEKTEAVLKRIAAAVGYEGDDPDELAGMVERIELDRQRLLTEDPPRNVTMALDLPEDSSWPEFELAAIQTAALLDNAEIELAAANMEAAMLNKIVSDLRGAMGVMDSRVDLVAVVNDMANKLKGEQQLSALYLEELSIARERLDVATKAAWVESEPVQTSPAIPANHLLDLATTFLANPNAGCEEVAGWILSVQGEAA